MIRLVPTPLLRNLTRRKNDDMSKTIEELAKQYAEDMCPIGDYWGGIYDGQRNSNLPIYFDDAKSVLTWLFAKPLAQRLTPEEKERMKRFDKRKKEEKI